MPFFCKKNPTESSQSVGLRGIIDIPGDRCLSHFSMILGGIASGRTQIRGLLESDDVLNTMRMMNYLGAHFTKKNSEWIVDGVGNGCLLSPKYPLNFKNFDMGYELMMGLVGVYDFETFFKGGRKVSQEIIEYILTPLRQMGVQVIPHREGCFSVALRGPRTPNPISYISPLALPQVKSAVLLAGLNTPGITEVVEPVKTQNHMEILLREFGVDLMINSNTSEDYSVKIKGRGSISGCNLKIPGDPSLALFPLAAALLIPESDIKILNVLINPLRIGSINILQEMGADINFSNHRIENGENVADIQVRFSNLKGITISEDRVSFAIDEYPILLVISAFAEGKTIMKGLGKLMRSKQFSSLLECFKINNVQYEKGEDYLVVMGMPKGKGLGSSAGHVVRSNFDCITMSFLIMGLASEHSIFVDDCSDTSAIFPKFINLMQGLGARIEWID
ncbi:3-phosphoshikimate 1-carboxyvinyltransferase [Candidatus Liberibacter africanus]|uniref:3-phosphoshikimate 1-carboxyvinyltransferase n=1 Tax=Liberibacter africanus TaxID=34020 RepID=UPI00339DA488